MSLIHLVRFIKKEEVAKNIFTFYFKKPLNIELKSGQYGLFIEPEFARPHSFSFSSSPTEKYLCFSTTVHQNSRFKQNLMKMKPNNKLLLLGPLQNFNFENLKSKYLFLAQGIGITPFRALFQDSTDRQLNTSITLIHVAKDEHAFKDLTNNLASKAYYPNNANNFRELLLTNLDAGLFYIAGSSQFVKATKSLLIENHIPSNKVIGDAFLGYTLMAICVF